MVNCPFCGGLMRKEEQAVPSFLNPVDAIQRHPLPLLRRWGTRAMQGTIDDIEKNVETHLCPKCGFIALFYKKR